MQLIEEIEEYLFTMIPKVKQKKDFDRITFGPCLFKIQMITQLKYSQLKTNYFSSIIIVHYAHASHGKRCLACADICVQLKAMTPAYREEGQNSRLSAP